MPKISWTEIITSREETLVWQLELDCQGCRFPASWASDGPLRELGCLALACRETRHREGGLFGVNLTEDALLVRLAGAKALAGVGNDMWLSEKVACR